MSTRIISPFVLLAGEAQGAVKQKFLPMIRSGNGKFFGFGESNLPQYDNFQGRFAEILPPQAPTTDMKSMAKLLLQAMGVTNSALQGDPRWS